MPSGLVNQSGKKCSLKGSPVAGQHSITNSLLLKRAQPHHACPVRAEKLDIRQDA